LTNPEAGLPLRCYWNPQAGGDDLSAHNNTNGGGAQRHGKVLRHASSTSCNTITSSIITAALSILMVLVY
jgi:hypothetical protein